MLYHHGSETYDVAASACAKNAREKLEAQIEKGRTQALSIIDKITREVPEDKIVRVGALEFDAKPREAEPVQADLIVRTGEIYPWEKLHRNALGQIAEKADIPMAYVNHLQGQGVWGQKLLANNLRELFGHRDEKERYLTRSISNEMRGFLSNKYRRLDTRSLLENVVEAFGKIGVVPVDGIGTDTRVRIRAMLPLVFEPVPNEIVGYGLDWGNSDYGNGAHSLSMFVWRAWCTNFATTESVLREVHLGARLSEDMAWSDKTYRLDTERSISMLNDAVHAQLSAGKVEEMNALIKTADAEKIDARQLDAWLKQRLGKGMATRVKEAFTGADVEMLPPGNSKWRLSNALSWVAGNSEDKEEALDLQRLAGKVLEDIRIAA